MNGIEMLKTRRSVRKYLDTSVPKDKIDILLEVAYYSPSGHNKHPVHYVIVDDKEILQSFKNFHESASMFDTAPLGIVICGDMTEAWATWRDDCAAVTTNICNAAHELELGSCWCGLYPRDARVDGMKKAINLPNHIMPYSMIVIGYLDLDVEVKQPNRDYSDRVHQNGW